MAIVFDPAKMLKTIAPEAKVKRMISDKFTLKRTALTFIDAAADKSIGLLDKKSIASVARRTIKNYQKRRADAVIKADYDKKAGTEFQKEIIDDPALLIQRVQNEIVFQTHEKIKDQYDGQKARWLPSDAEEPRPEHQLNYGKEYIIGEGINGVEPGDEYGCRCGVEILVNETKLNLD